MAAESLQIADYRAASCAYSPSGAHHWIVEAPSPTMKGECKYCGGRRTFRPFGEEPGFNGSLGWKQEASELRR